MVVVACFMQWFHVNQLSVLQCIYIREHGSTVYVGMVVVVCVP